MLNGNVSGSTDEDKKRVADQLKIFTEHKVIVEYIDEHENCHIRVLNL